MILVWLALLIHCVAEPNKINEMVVKRVYGIAVLTAGLSNARQVSCQAPGLIRQYSSTATATPPTGGKLESKVVENQNEDGMASGGGNAAGEEQTALSRRLAEFTEEALNENPRFMKAAVASGEFDYNTELKQKLQERIACADFKSTNAQALSVANLPVRFIALELSPLPPS